MFKFRSFQKSACYLSFCSVLNLKNISHAKNYEKYFFAFPYWTKNDICSLFTGNSPEMLFVISFKTDWKTKPVALFVYNKQMLCFYS